MDAGSSPPDQPDDDLLDEYDFSAGVRGKYARAYAGGSKIVVLAPDIAAAFPDSRAVNEALRALVEIAGRTVHNESARGDGRLPPP